MHPTRDGGELTGLDDDPRPEFAGATRPEAATGPRETVLSLKGAPQWREWLEELATRSRLPKSTLVDLALTDYARKIGFLKDPPKR